MMKLKYFIKTLVRMISLVIGVSILSFVLVTNSPIDPLTAYVGSESTLSEEAKAEVAEHWGLNDPPIERFLVWGNNFIHGDLGTSITYKQPVSTVIFERFKYSFALMITAWILSGVIGFILGILAGTYQGSLFDKIIKLICLIFQSSPTFWVGLIMLSLFSVYLGWFPIGLAAPMGKIASQVTLVERIHHMILPAITLSVLCSAKITLFTRQKLIEILNSDFILFAKARGESTKQIILNHGLRNVAFPAITEQFASFSELFGGIALAETVFSYPGIGSAVTAAGLKCDVPLLLGIAIFSTIFVFVGNLTANILYEIIDPRLKEESYNA